MSAEFCDTNIIVYAYDSTAGVKHDRAQALLERLWLEGVGALSVQVLQELFVTLTRKVVRPVDHAGPGYRG
jgi:predicted nucleic acid-binding protein